MNETITISIRASARKVRHIDNEVHESKRTPTFQCDVLVAIDVMDDAVDAVADIMAREMAKSIFRNDEFRAAFGALKDAEVHYVATLPPDKDEDGGIEIGPAAAEPA